MLLGGVIKIPVSSPLLPLRQLLPRFPCVMLKKLCIRPLLRYHSCTSWPHPYRAIELHALLVAIVEVAASPLSPLRQLLSLSPLPLSVRPRAAVTAVSARLLASAPAPTAEPATLL